MPPKTWKHHLGTLLLLVSGPVAFVASWYARTAAPLQEKIHLFATVWSAVAFTVTIILTRVDEAYLWWQRIRRWGLNATTRWTFVARFDVAPSIDGPSLFESTVKQLVAHPNASLRSRDATQPAAVMLLDGVPLDVRLTKETTLDDDGSRGDALRLVFDVPDARTPYRHARRVFEQTLSAILEEAQKATASRENKFELTFSFPAGTNPFFGPMVKRLAPTESFQWRYSTATAQHGILEVTKDSVVVVTRTVNEVQVYFRRLIGLSLAPAQIG